MNHRFTYCIAALFIFTFWGCSQDIIEGKIAPATVPVKPSITFTVKVDTVEGGSVTISPAQATYGKDDYVKATATPDTGYAFTGWIGTASGTDNPLLFTITKNEWIIPVFTAVQTPAVPAQVTYTIKTDEVAGGTVALSPAQAAYGKDDYVKITATSDAGYAFSCWSGTVNSAANPLLLTVTKNEWIIPVFTAVQTPTVPEKVAYTIKVDTASGGTASIDPAKTAYLAGENAKITATADSGYFFAGWSGTASGDANPLLLTISKSEWIIPQFTKTQSYALSTNFSPVGGSVTSSCGSVTSFTAGQKCVLHAEPSSGYRFDGWEGDITGTGNDVYITFNKDYQVYAKFSVIPVAKTWTLDTSGCANGSIACVPSKSVYYDGETVRVTANPEPGFMFNSWSGSYAPNPQTFDLKITSDATLGCEFMKRTWTVVVYMAADNDLESAAIKDINEMESVNYEGMPISVLALIDRSPGYDQTNGNWTDTRLYEIASDTTNTTINSRRISCARLGLTTKDETELDMADPLNLSYLLSFAKEEYSADEYALIFWGHGSGWRGSADTGSSKVEPVKAVSVDDTSGTCMPIAKAESAIGDKGFSTIAFDTCFASLLEIAFEFRSSAHWLLGSEGATSSDGWDYASLFSTFGETGFTEADFRASVISQFKNCYSVTPNASISAIDLSKAGTLKVSFDAFASAVASHITDGASQKTIRDILLKDCELCQTGGALTRDVFIDISSMCAKLSPFAGASATSILSNSISDAVTDCWSQSNPGAKKIGVHLVPYTGTDTVSLPHSPAYIKGSGVADQSELVRTSTGWIPNQTLSASSLLDMVFYKTF